MEKDCKLPTSYGYSHRRFYVMTKREYKIFFGKVPDKKQQDKKIKKQVGGTQKIPLKTQCRGCKCVLKA